MPTPTYTPLATLTKVGTGAMIFQSIPATHRDLVLIIDGSVATTGFSGLRFNGDNGTNYSFANMVGNGTSATSTTGLNNTSARFATIDTNRNLVVINIMDYSATDKHKTIISRASSPSSQTSAFVSRWADTSAINSVTVQAPLTPGTTISLYGIAS